MLKAAEKIQKQGYCQANIKDEIKVISTTVIGKGTVDLHTDLPTIKLKNLGYFYATYYSLIVRFSGKYFPKLSKPSSKLVTMRLGEFIINAKTENQFEDAVFNRNLSDKEISRLQYLGGYVTVTFTKNLEIQKYTKVISFNKVWL